MRYLVWYGDHLLPVTATTDTLYVETGKQSRANLLNLAICWLMFYSPRISIIIILGSTGNIL